MKTGFLFSLLTLAGSLLQADSGSIDTTPFAHQRSLENSREDEGLGILQLDSEIFRNVRQDLGDLRLLSEGDGGRIEVPFLIERKKISEPSRQSRPISSKVLDFSEAEDGAIEVKIELEKKAGKAALVKIETPLRDFEKQIKIEGSSDGNDWSDLVNDGLIFDHERFLDFRRTSLELPANQFRFFRVRISDATDQQRSLVRSLHKTVSESSGVTVQESLTVTKRNFRIDRLAFYTEEQAFEKKMSTLSYPTRILENEINEDDKRSEILLDVESCPVDTLVFETPDRNFRRSIEVQVPRGYSPNGEVVQWRTYSKNSIHRFQIGDFSEEKLTVSIPPLPMNQRAKQLRILISNGDSPPIAVDKIEAYGEIYEMKFLAVPNTDWTLFFGAEGKDIRRPSYDVSAIRVADREKVKQVQFSGGAVIANTEFSGSGTVSPLLNQPWVLWLAIVAVVGCLILVLVRAAGKIQEMDGLEEDV